MNAKELRRAAGKSRAWVAAHAGVSEPTARLYELAPDAVSERPRKALAAVYARLAAGLVPPGGGPPMPPGAGAAA
jgi:hypothetical protein